MTFFIKFTDGSEKRLGGYHEVHNDKTNRLLLTNGADYIDINKSFVIYIECLDNAQI